MFATDDTYEDKLITTKLIMIMIIIITIMIIIIIITMSTFAVDDEPKPANNQPPHYTGLVHIESRFFAHWLNLKIFLNPVH